MGRLIDADALSEELGKHYIGSFRLDTLVQQYIDAQPTAYDVEKVVAELEEKKGTYFDGLTCEGTKIAINEAIDIVRKGGVE